MKNSEGGVKRGGKKDVRMKIKGEGGRQFYGEIKKGRIFSKAGEEIWIGGKG